MQYTVLGRTGLRVSVAGLGAGGHSQLGRAHGATESDSVALVQRALDLGVNFIDTALTYGTEPIVGMAVRSRRTEVIISSKAPVVRTRAGEGRVTAAEFARSIDHSLAQLRTDYIDLYSAHAVPPDLLDYVHTEILPVLLAARDQGKIRFLGITEQFAGDPGHGMLARAIQGDAWDVVMTGFNFLNPSARHRVLRFTREKRIGVLAMFAVRRALTSERSLRESLMVAHAAGQIETKLLNSAEQLGFLLKHATNLVEAAYRFCRHEPGVDVVLTGTGKIEHLEENLSSIDKPALPAAALARLESLFGEVDCLSGD
jgi:L-galactose dehydrogenase